jgi:hypothetical protein
LHRWDHRIDKRLAPGAQFGAQSTDVLGPACHGDLGEAQLGQPYCAEPATAAGSRTGRQQTGHGAILDLVAFKFGDWPENAEYEATTGCCHVDIGARPGEDPESDVALPEVAHGVDQVLEVLAEAVEFPDDKRVAVAPRFQTCIEAGASVAVAGGQDLVKMSLVDADGEFGVALQVKRPRPVGSEGRSADGVMPQDRNLSAETAGASLQSQ